MSEEKKVQEAVQPPVEDSDHQPEARKEPLETTVYEWARCLIAAVVSVVLLFTFCVRLIGVSGGSMQNTFFTGDRLVVLNSMFCDFKQGDVVVADAYNAMLDDTIVKRIIAVGGQTVDIDFFTGTVYVDGVALEEPYTKEPTYTADGTQFPLTLAEDEVFLMGDNRNRSTDSRSYTLGPVKEGYLQGKAIFLLFPGKTEGTDKLDFGRIGLIK